MCKKIDCVILNYNDADTTTDIINHIKEYSVFNHIIVVDNCSTDNSLDRLKKISDDRIIVLSSKTNGGYGAGNNIGVKYSYKNFKSDYVVIANPDVIFDAECINALCNTLEDDDKCAIAAPIQLNSKGEIINDYAWPFPTIWQTIFSAGHYLKRIMWKTYGFNWLNQRKKDNVNSAIVDCVPGAMLMVRTKEFCRIGGYDERNFLYWEEAILGKKVIENNLYSKILITHTYVHNHSVSINKSIPKAINRIKLLLKGRYFFLKNYTGAKSFHLLLAKVFLGICIIEETIITKVKNI